MPDPQVPDDVTFSELDRDVRGRLRTLSKDSAERVGRHLVMVGRLLDLDPELAYEHAQAAVRRGGRVDVVREAAGLAAYRTGRYGEALRELRTVRRLNGSPEHLPVMADCERGLGRPERALVVAQDPGAADLSADAQVELAMVVSGARLDLEEPEAAVAALATPVVRAATGMLAARVAQARAAALRASGRDEDAERELAGYTADQLAEAAGDLAEEEEEVVVYDLLDDTESLDDTEDLDGTEDLDDTEPDEVEPGGESGDLDEPEDLGGAGAEPGDPAVGSVGAAEAVEAFDGATTVAEVEGDDRSQGAHRSAEAANETASDEGSSGDRTSEEDE